LREYIDGVYGLLEALGVQGGLWGHAGDGIIHVQPRFNLAQVGDRQKAFRLMDEYNKLVIGLGGTISSEASDGRMHTPYLEKMYGTQAYALLQKVNQIFDPYGTMNPGVKFGTSVDDIKAMLRPDFNLAHLYDHLPRS
jgi:FAD/FMN-containing dehydrogenase